jgi:hypothetical protein
MCSGYFDPGKTTKFSGKIGIDFILIQYRLEFRGWSNGIKTPSLHYSIMKLSF